MSINLICCTKVICNEVQRGVAQKDVALSYAMAIKSEAEKADEPDWKAINAAIIDRWGMSGLQRVKRSAWWRIASAGGASMWQVSESDARNMERILKARGYVIRKARKSG